jgi:tetratricopeptide (TPR) repeat protein
MSAANASIVPEKFYRSLRVALLRLLILISAAMAVAVYLQYPTEQKSRASFHDDLLRIDNAMAQLNPKEPRYAFLQFQKAQLTGNFEDFYNANHLLKAFPNDRELLFLRAKIALNMHDITEGKSLYDKLSIYPNDSRTVDLAIDIALQLGQYSKAIEILTQRLQRDAQWSDLARYAYLLHKFGDSTAADAIYSKAQERLSIKQVKDYSWLELQRGIIDLENGNHTDALAHFELANRTYPGHWLIEEHLAETYALLGHPKTAIALYEKVIRQSDNPIYFFALGNLRKDEQPARADQLFHIAEEKFQQRYSRYPLAASGHLIDIWIKEQEKNPTTVNLTRLLQLTEINLFHRPNAEAMIQRIKVLMLDRDMTAARQLTASLLETPWRTADVAHLADEFDANIPTTSFIQIPDDALTDHEL